MVPMVLLAIQQLFYLRRLHRKSL